MDFLSAAVAPLAKAILSRVGKEIGGSAIKGARALVLGDPEQKALERALSRAFAGVGRIHGPQLANFDINPDFWGHEGAAELAKVLTGGQTPSAARLAERAVDSLGRSRSDDERLDRVFALRPVFAAMLAELAREVRAESALHGLLERADTARTAEATSAIAEAVGAGATAEDDRFRYLGWLVDQHRYLRTAGVVRNTTVQLPLEEVFVGLRAQHDRHPGDRARTWFEHERRKALAMLETGQLDQTGYEAALDRLETQYGRKFAADGRGAPDQPVLVLDAVRDASQVLVLGDPGTGKTTLLRYLALCHARGLLTGEPVQGRPARLPIYVRIGDYARQGHPRVGISDFLPDYLNRSECRLPGLAGLLERQLEAGQCLVLLDGLDEVASAELRRGVVAAVVNFVAAYSRAGNRFVVTSRVAGYQAAPLPQPFTAMRLHDMDDATISRFLQVYCRQVERAETPGNSQTAIIEAGARETAAIEQALRSNAGVRRLAANPLLLTALVLVHRASGRLPHRRVEAYVEVCSALGRTWRSAQGVADADLPDERILTRWLTELGAWMHQHRPEGAATRAELLQVLGPLWAAHQGTTWDPAELLSADPLNTEAGRGVLEFVEKADTHTGLLVERAPGRYGFAHLTFEEYYTGRALAFRGTAIQRVTTMRGRLHDPRYAEPILLALGLIGTDYADQIDEVVAQAVYPGTEPSPHEDLLGRDFLFMLRILADDTPVLTVTIDEVIARAIDELLDAEHSRCRFTSYRHALERHIAALTGTKAADRYITAVDRRADRLADDAVGPWIGLAAIAAQLGPLPAATLAALKQLATCGTDDEMQARAGAALARSGALTEPMITTLLQLATDNDADPGSRTRAVALLTIGDTLIEPVITALLQLATINTDLSVQLEAVSTLAYNRALTEPVITAMLQLATDNNVGRAIRTRAVSALTYSDSLTEPVITALLQLATNDNADPAIRTRAVSALTYSDSLTEPVITALLQLATNADTDPDVRLEAVSGLARGRALTAPVITAVLQLVTLSETEPNVQARAVSALTYSDLLTEPVITALLHLTTHSDTDPNLRARAVLALGNAGGALAEPAITNLRRLAADTDTDPDVRAHAGSALAHGGMLNEPVIAALCRLAIDTEIDPLVRARTVSALAANGDALSEPVITTLLQITADAEASPILRTRAGSALARNGVLTDPVIATLLQIATSRAQYLVRVQALKALQEASPTPALQEAVVGLFRDDDNDVRRTAAETLVEWSRRHPEYAHGICMNLAGACTQPALEARDEFEGRTGWDYAYDGLKAHVEAFPHLTS